MANFKLKELKKYSTSQLYNYRAMAMHSQGNGYLFSNMLKNRINKIGAELQKRRGNINN